MITGETIGTITHGIGALYQGVGATKQKVIQESADIKGGPLVANTAAFFKLAKTVEVTAANAPNGFLYAMVALVYSVQPSLVTVTAPEAKVNFTASKTPFTIGSKAGPAYLSATTAPAAEGGEKAQAELETSVTNKTEATLVLLV